MLTCTILDDYQGVARSFADWDSLPGVRVRALSEHLVGRRHWSRRSRTARSW